MKLSAHEVLEIHESDAVGIDNAVSRGGGAARMLVPVGPASMVYYFAAKKSLNQAEQFFDALRTGSDLSQGDPVLALRNRLIKSRNLGKANIKDFEMAAMLIHAWNAFRGGQKLTLMVGTKVMGDKTPTLPSIK